MKMTEIIGGLRMPLSNEENNLVEKIKNKKMLEVSKLNEREREIMIGLCRRNVINIEKDEITFNGLQPAEEALW